MNFKKNMLESSGDFKEDKYSTAVFDNMNIDEIKKTYDSKFPIIKNIIIEKNNMRKNSGIKLKFTIFDDISREEANKLIHDEKGVMAKLTRRYDSCTSNLPVSLGKYTYTSEEKTSVAIKFNIGLLTKDEMQSLLEILQFENKYISKKIIKEIISLCDYRVRSKEEENLLGKIDDFIKSYNLFINENLVNNEANKLYLQADKIDKADSLNHLTKFNLAKKFTSAGLDGFAIAIYKKIPNNTLLEDKSKINIGNIIYNQAVEIEKTDPTKYRKLLKEAFRNFSQAYDKTDVLCSKILYKLSLNKDSIQSTNSDPIEIILNLSDKCYEANQKLNKIEKKYKKLKKMYSKLQEMYNKLKSVIGNSKKKPNKFYDNIKNFKNKFNL